MPRVTKASSVLNGVQVGSSCKHDILYTAVSPHARQLSYYAPPTKTNLLAAASRTGKPPTDSSSAKLPPHASFPGVNLVPQDELDQDPKDEGDTLVQFLSNRGRPGVTPSRRTIYVVETPNVAPDIAGAMASWTEPVIPGGPENGTPSLIHPVGPPRVDDVAGYLQAFYAGMEVKVLKNHFCFRNWKKGQNGPNSEQSRGHVALKVQNGQDGRGTWVRFRPSKDGVTAGQLNLNDMLDALLESIPSDAFAIILITDHDLYEDEDDDFCAGRAYGGSRICTVSTFRYNPALDAHAGINHAHSWPASHCRDYIDDCWEKSEPALKDTDYGCERRKRGGAKLDPLCMLSLKKQTETPLAAAVLASRDVLVPTTTEDWDGLWLARVCRTASHELGHCVGIGHCAHYSCMMQSTASMAEDIRQPPYLCPICIQKAAYSMAGDAVMKSRGLDKDARRVAAEADWIAESYRQTSLYCEGRSGVGMFSGLGAWSKARLAELGVSEGLSPTGEDQDEVMDDDSSIIFMGASERV